MQNKNCWKYVASTIGLMATIIGLLLTLYVFPSSDAKKNLSEINLKEEFQKERNKYEREINGLKKELGEANTKANEAQSNVSRLEGELNRFKASYTGRWSGTGQDNSPYQLTLSQNGDTLTGGLSDGHHAYSGTVDPSTGIATISIRRTVGGRPTILTGKLILNKDNTAFTQLVLSTDGAAELPRTYNSFIFFHTRL